MAGFLETSIAPEVDASSPPTSIVEERLQTSYIRHPSAFVLVFGIMTWVNGTIHYCFQCFTDFFWSFTLLKKFAQKTLLKKKHLNNMENLRESADIVHPHQDLLHRPGCQRKAGFTDF